MVLVTQTRRSTRWAPTPAAILAGICVILALGCVGLALAWKHEHDEAACWRAAFEEGDTRAADPCG